MQRVTMYLVRGARGISSPELPQHPVDSAGMTCGQLGSVAGLSHPMSHCSEKLWTKHKVSHMQHWHCENANSGSPHFHSTTTTTTFI